MADQVVDHLVPNQVRGSFESLGESERENGSLFKGLEEPFSAQIQGN
jgi:hypothetical protein